MKSLIKGILHNRVFQKLIHHVPFIYDKGQLEKFETLLSSVKAAGPDVAKEILKQYSLPINYKFPGKSKKSDLLQFLTVTLINPPVVWDKYNSKLFKFDNSGKIHVNYQFGVNFNPATLCQYALSLFDSYWQTNKLEYRDLFLKQVEFLLEESEGTPEGLIFPYRYDFFDMLKGPWLSGLAQGQGIAILLRAFILTDDSSYLDQAKKAYLAINAANKLEINVNGYDWVEEYPTEKPSCAINGFTSVIICLLELQKFFPEDVELSDKIDNYLKTFRDNVDSYDQGNGAIRYSLIDEKLVNNNYLGFQCLQMLHLYYYTNDVFFYNRHIKWQTYFNHKEFVTSYLPFNKWNRRLRDLSKGV